MSELIPAIGVITVMNKMMDNNKVLLLIIFNFKLICSAKLL